MPGYAKPGGWESAWTEKLLQILSLTNFPFFFKFRFCQQIPRHAESYKFSVNKYSSSSEHAQQPVYCGDIAHTSQSPQYCTFKLILQVSVIVGRPGSPHTGTTHGISCGKPCSKEIANSPSLPFVTVPYETRRGSCPVSNPIYLPDCPGCLAYAYICH